MSDMLAKIALGTTALVAMGGPRDGRRPHGAAAGSGLAMTSDWTGGYIGVSGTYLSVEGVTEQIAEANAVLGADFETGMFLVGGRAEIGYSHDLTLGNNFWTVTLQGRAGAVVGDNALIYGAVGAEDYIGGVVHPMVGLGVEFKTSDNLAVDLEYRHFWTSGGPAADAITGSLLW